LIRSVSQTLDPQEVAEALVAQAYGWLPAAKARARSHRAFLSREGLNIHLTVSVGAAILPDVAASAEALIKAADTAMYRVKGDGKDGARLATQALLTT
jgi:GGDEF domain-containing protein